MVILYFTSLLGTRKLKWLSCRKRRDFHLVRVRLAGGFFVTWSILATSILVHHSVSPGLGENGRRPRLASSAPCSHLPDLSLLHFSFLFSWNPDKTMNMDTICWVEEKSYYQTHFIILPQFKPHLILKCDFCIPNIFWSKPGCFWAQTLQSLDGSQLQICRPSCQSEEGGLINFSKLYFLT